MNEVHMLIHGGIGDQIIALPFIQMFKGKNLKVIVYTKFKDIAGIFLDWVTIKTREEFPKEKPPAIWFEVIDIVKINYTNRNIVLALPRFMQDIFHSYETKLREWNSIIQRHPGSCNELAKKAVAQGLNRRDLIFHLVNQPYKKFEFDVPSTQGAEFLTLHTGFDDSHNFDLSTKSWNLESYEFLVKNLKILYPKLGIVQVGGKKHQPIKGVDINLAGKLDFRNSLRYLKTSVLHIDNDSGLVHARALFNKPSIVLFGPTDINYFGYPDNINIKHNSCSKSPCWWTKSNWMQHCPADLPMEKASMCMNEISYGHVLGQVMQFMDKKEADGPQKPKTHSPLLDFDVL
jgi:hypothetical protein